MTKSGLQNWIDITTILTFCITLIGATVGLYGYFRDVYEFRSKTRALENYLQTEKQAGADQGQRTILHNIRHVGLTEDEGGES